MSHLAKALVGVGVALLMWAGWAIVSAGERVTAIEARHAIFERWLERVEGKLDRMLEKR